MDTSEPEKMFHKNLFLDDINSPDNFPANDTDPDSDDQYSDDEEYNVFDQSCKRNSNLHTLNHLPAPLTESIAEVLQEFSKEKFFFDDLSFIFEMSRKRAISPYAIIVALIYLNRLKSKTAKASANTSSLLSSKSIGFDKYSASYLSNTELCLISLLLASKYLIDEGEDEEIYNEDWAKASELPVKEINKLEKSFLRQMDWELYVSSNEFWSFTNTLTEKITRKKVINQYNQCTYSDLEYLLSNSRVFSSEAIRSYLNLIAKLFFICSSTLVYITLSGFYIFAYVHFLKNHISMTSIMNIQTSSDNQHNLTNTEMSTYEPVSIKSQTISNPMEITDSQIFDQNNLDSNFDEKQNVTSFISSNEHENKCQFLNNSNELQVIAVFELGMNKKSLFYSRKKSELKFKRNHIMRIL